MRILFQFKPIIFNHRITQEFVARVVDLLPDLFRFSRDLDFEVLAYVDSRDSLVAHVLQGALDRFSLWVQDCLFRSNNNFCFHIKKNLFYLVRSDLGESSGRTLVFFHVRDIGSITFTNKAAWNSGKSASKKVWWA